MVEHTLSLFVTTHVASMARREERACRKKSSFPPDTHLVHVSDTVLRCNRGLLHHRDCSVVNETSANIIFNNARQCKSPSQ